MRPNATARLTVVVWLLAAGAAGAQGPKAEVFQLAVSPDGRQVAAYYFAHAWNRPGTDWQAYVVRWDVADGRGIVASRGCGPIAFADDGSLQLGFYQRQRAPETTFAAEPRPAVWKPADAAPAPAAPLRPAIPPRHAAEAVRPGIPQAPVKQANPAALPEDWPLAGEGGVWAQNEAGRLIAAAGADGAVHVFDGTTRKRVAMLKPQEAQTAVRVAAVQAASTFAEPARNREHLAGLIARAAEAGANIVVLPETAITGYLTPDLKKAWQAPGREVSAGLQGVDPAKWAEQVMLGGAWNDEDAEQSKSVSEFAALARKHAIYLTVPIVEFDAKEKLYYNTLVLVDPAGRVRGHYRKINPWPWAERGWAAEGKRHVVVPTEYGRLGLLICYDIHKQAEEIGRLKADILLYSIAWVEDEGSTWFDESLPKIARANGYHMVAANWTVPADARPDWFGFGQSRIITREGKIIAKVGDNRAEEVVIADLLIPAGLPQRAEWLPRPPRP